jgi:hypothetical protein
MSLHILWGRQPLVALGIVTVLALIGLTLAMSALMIVAGQVIPPLLSKSTIPTLSSHSSW